jgi:multiple antibiotic resistance protein
MSVSQRFPWRPVLRIGFACAAGCIATGTALAADAAGAQVPIRQIPLSEVFTILFLMLGPFKTVGPYLKLTREADDSTARQLALRAAGFATVMLLLAGFLGESFLGRYGVPLPVLGLSGGLILFLVAIRRILEQFEMTEAQASPVSPPAPNIMRSALMPLAFPTIVTPYGIAALIVFLALAQTIEERMEVGGVLVGIMALNLIVMLLGRRLAPVFAIALPIFGAVLGVVQVAVGLQIINTALHALGVL